MNETRRVHVISVGGEERVFPELAGPGLAARIPESVEIAIDGLPWEAVATLARVGGSLVVDEVRVRRRPGRKNRLPQRAHRDLALSDLVAIVREVVQVGKITDWGPGPSVTFEPSATKRLSDAYAEQILRGPTKSQESMRLMRRRVVWEYRKARREGQWSDIYAEVARRLDISRATVHRHLRDSGELEGRKK